MDSPRPAIAAAESSRISDSRIYLDSHPVPVQPESTLYNNVYSTETADQSKQTQKKDIVSGVHLIFQKGNENNLFDTYNVDRGRTTITDLNSKMAYKSLLIVCDTLTIHGELSLPECDVTIYARKLELLDAGCINTSPLPWSDALKRAQDAAQTGTSGEDGATGHNAGSISVFVANVLPSTCTPFIAHGGAGQNAGLGKAGADGSSVPYSCIFQNHFDGLPSKDITVDTGANATYFYGRWLDRWNGGPPVFGTTASSWGQDEAFPGDGTDALPGGSAGKGGRGGDFTCLKKDAAVWVDNGGGDPGQHALRVAGGAAGKPVEASQCYVNLWYGSGHNGPSGTDWEIWKGPFCHTSQAGKDWTPTDNPAAGQQGNINNPDAANSWVHPDQLQAVLIFARDAFLSGQRDDVMAMLKDYKLALAEGRPANAEAWDDNNKAQWTSEQSEVASILQRIQNNLDYFGNPAGYMPFLSLQGSMQLYDVESKRALQTLLLEQWVADRTKNSKDSIAACTDAINSLNSDSSTVADKLVEQKNRIITVSGEIDSVQTTLGSLQAELTCVQERLEKEAENIEQQKAAIKFAVKMVGAILQVIPAGQPALGAVGKLADVFADVDDNGVPKTLTSMGDVLKETKDAAKTAKEATDKVKDEKEGSSGWPTAGQMGAALSQAGDAIAALKVPQEDIDTELSKLEAQSPEWNELAAKIRDFTAQKEKLFTELMNTLQSVNDGYARLAGNAQAVVTLQQQKGSNAALLNPAATRVIQEMGQHSRAALIYSLYLLVKAYETTMFKSLQGVNWQLTEVFDKITNLLKSGQDWTADNVNQMVETLAPIFQSSLDAIKDQLLQEFAKECQNERTAPRPLSINSDNDSDALEVLNDRGWLAILPLERWLIQPGDQKSRITSIKLTKIEFEGTLPKVGAAILTLTVDSEGTMRYGKDLYVVRSAAPRIWKWTYLFGENEVRPDTPSLSFNDLLQQILGESESTQTMCASLPLWSDMVLSLEYTQPFESPPKVANLMFEVEIDYLPAPDGQIVVNVSCNAPATIKCEPTDLAGRSIGTGGLYQIYQGPQNIKLQVDAPVGQMQFSHWQVNGESYSTNPVDLAPQRSMFVSCIFNPVQSTVSQLAQSETTEDATPLPLRTGASEAESVLEKQIGI